MNDDIEKKIGEFYHLLESEDPITLQRLQIEVQIEQLRQTAVMNQMLNQRLSGMTKLLETMDWKLWETVKVLKPEIDSGVPKTTVQVVQKTETTVEPVAPEVPVEDDEFKIVDGKYVRR